MRTKVVMNRFYPDPGANFIYLGSSSWPGHDGNTPYDTDIYKSAEGELYYYNTSEGQVALVDNYDVVKSFKDWVTENFLQKNEDMI